MNSKQQRLQVLRELLDSKRLEVLALEQRIAELEKPVIPASKRCELCGDNEAVSAWQPFGPDEVPRDAFTALGSHYRGYPILKVCHDCKGEIQNGEPMVFDYKGRTYDLIGEDSPIVRIKVEIKHFTQILPKKP